MHIDFSTISPRDRYKLLVSTVVPRPIALVTSMRADGQLNAAPFSFFNAMGSDPPLLVINIGDRDPDIPKDTAQNIRQTGEYVVNIVDESMAEQMNICAVDFPHGTSEVAAAGFTTVASVGVKPPRLAESPINFECREYTTLEIGRNRLVIGEVLHFHIRDDLIDVEKLYVNTERLHAIGRMHGAGWYARTTDLFQMPRMSYEEWQEMKGE
ncbi:MAG: flavin reductase family protein [Abitibacteriaceae bacterium]|nr:flavin reductase family protein [Abditibacteriaceae bacterium]